jgi:hypothetical protein
VSRTLDTVPVEIEPPELARLLDFAERPRVQDWSLRAALVRYAQPQPQRVEALLEVIRRTDAALARNSKIFEREGAAIWHALADGSEDAVVALLRVAEDVDRLGDVLVAWAVERDGPSPDAEVDRVTADTSGRLDALGIPREERPPGPRNRG